MYIQNVNLDVNAQPDANAKPCLRLSQNENGRVLMIRIIGVDIPEGSTANFAGVKPDGNVYSKSGTVEGNVVSINEDIQMTAVSGAWNAKITVVNDGNNICTARIRVVVDASVVPGDAIPSDSQLDGIVAECQAYAESAKNAAYGSPLTANTAAGMTDQDRVYVYTGSETGYTAGHWYYYDGSAWADGGVYNSVAVDTDTSLTISGKAADAKATGDEITSLNTHLIENTTTLVSVHMDLLENEKFQLKPNRVIFKKIHVEKPIVVNSITVHSTNHPVGQHFNVAIYNTNFTELTTMSGKNRGGAALRYFVETGERGFLGNDTECSIPKVELCGDYLVAFKTGTQLNSTIRVVQEDSYCTSGYLRDYPSRITSGLVENIFAVDIDLNYIPEPLEISRTVTVTDMSAVHVCGIDSNKKLYGYNTSTGKIIVSADNGSTWEDMCDYTYTPLQIVVDVTNSCAYYSSGARIFKITGLGSGATSEEITPTSKRHSFAMSLCESLRLSHGYLWYGEYSTSTAAQDGSYTAEKQNQLNYPYLLRYNISTGEWHRSARFSGRHIHCCIADTDYLYIIVGDYNIGQDVGIHRLAFADIVDDADLEDGVIRYTSAVTQSFVGRIDISGQNWYNVNALIHNINGIKCIVGGSDRPLASCVVTKIDDETVGSAVSFPQCFSYHQPPADETSWNSFFDDRGNLWVVTRETATSKLMVMTPPFNKVYVVHDFNILLPYVGGYYSSANNVLWIGNYKINLPYIGTSNNVTPSTHIDLMDAQNDDYFTTEYGSVVKLENGEYYLTYKNGNNNNGGSAGIITSDFIDATNYQSVSAIFRISELKNMGSAVRIHVDAVDENGTKVKETFLSITTDDIGKQMLRTLDISTISGNVKIRAFIQVSSNNPNIEYSCVLQSLDMLTILNQFG